MATTTSNKKTAAEPDQDKSLYADVAEVKEFAESLPDNYLECREMNHIWKAWHGTYVEGGVLRILRCQRCKSERHQEISLSGAILSSHYKHAPGYLHQGLGRIVGDGRDALRVESLSRFMTKVAKQTEAKSKPKVPAQRKSSRSKTKVA